MASRLAVGKAWVKSGSIRKDFGTGRPWRADKLAGQSTCSDHTNLLAQYSPHRNLETIPTAGSPQPGTLCHQWGKHRIARQMNVDRLDISSKIEQAPHPGHDGR